MTENDPAQKAGLLAMAVLFPIWGILSPGILILFALLLLRLPANVNLGYALILAFTLILITFICGVATFFLEDKQIRVSKEGLCFPLTYCRGLKFRLERSWDDLRELKLKWNRQDENDPQNCIVLFFKSGGYAKFVLNKFASEEIEQFLIAFESCSINCQRDSDLDDFEYFLQSRKRGELPSYTQIWEKSLSNRFTGATFSPLEPGSKVHEGRYHILRQLGFGGFAAVYLARNSSGQNVVLKESVFPQTTEGLSKAEELFKREAAILSKLDNANISKVYDYFIENGRHYMSMEYIEGRNLQNLSLQEGPQSPERVLNWASQLANTLCYLHQQEPPVVHRDLSPDNILLRPDGSLVLIDFGAAKEIAGTFTGTIIGKQAYIAPEQLKGSPSTKSDIYSLGATLFFLLTGQQPVPLTSSKATDKSATVPEQLDSLIFKCTQLDEGQRPDAKEVIAITSQAAEALSAPTGDR
ncbi:MAG: serine/threonine protein kinase [Candidatus Obscuribacterales bacterium]|nr:serine/threonine protein kinase [Candidatus Obscuribacterales bacterium]